MAVINCPKCRGQLSVPTNLAGQVRCPHCTAAFAAVVRAGVSPPPAPQREALRQTAAAVRFKCPLCSSLYDRPEQFAGEIMACPSCRERIEVPRAAPKGAVLGELVETPLSAPAATPTVPGRWSVWPSYTAADYQGRLMAVFAVSALLLVVLVVSVSLLLVTWLVLAGQGR